LAGRGGRWGGFKRQRHGGLAPGDDRVSQLERNFGPTEGVLFESEMSQSKINAFGFV
jgi:hypothetical protein